MKSILLAREYEAWVDDNDFELVSAFKWYTFVGRHTMYARAFTHAPRKQFSMHRFILGAKPGEYVDHIDGNGLDNRHTNLRIVTQRQNQYNRVHKVSASSQYKGVCWHKASGKWMAQINAGPIGINGEAKQLYLGLFVIECDAARAYDRAAREHFGKFAATNFPL